MAAHIPVLLTRVLETLCDIKDKVILDATFGAGGYSRAFLERGAKVIAFDRDPSVEKFAAPLSKEYGKNFTFINSTFSTLASRGIVPPSLAEGGKGGGLIDAIVFDFGISSMQIDTPERGFSWRFDAPLDMRMGAGIPAAELIEKYGVEELAKIFKDYGDVRKAGVLARAIKSARPRTTFELRDLIFNPKEIAPVFQALRIAVNNELGEIETALASVPDMLADFGICACVTFHSLEDRLVKNIFKQWATPKGDPRMPQTPAPFVSLKSFRPDETELESNPRARSSHLRAVRKNGNIQ